jgi:hypothetical protein
MARPARRIPGCCPAARITLALRRPTVKPSLARAAAFPCRMRVARCSHPTYWWASRIGEVVLALVYREEEHDFLLQDGNAILADDVEFDRPARPPG